MRLKSNGNRNIWRGWSLTYNLAVRSGLPVTVIASSQNTNFGRSPRGGVRANYYRPLAEPRRRRYRARSRFLQPRRLRRQALPRKRTRSNRLSRRVLQSPELGKLGPPGRDMTNPAAFGAITAHANSPREIQFTLKYAF